MTDDDVDEEEEERDGRRRRQRSEDEDMKKKNNRKGNKTGKMGKCQMCEKEEDKPGNIAVPNVSSSLVRWSA